MLLLRLGSVAETSKETTISTTSPTFLPVEKYVSLEKQCVKSGETIQPQVARGPEAAPRWHTSKPRCEVRKERGPEAAPRRHDSSCEVRRTRGQL